MVSKHHINWRLEALKVLDREPDEDLHSTSIVSVSREDLPKIKSVLIEAMDRYNGIVAPLARGGAALSDNRFFSSGI